MGNDQIVVSVQGLTDFVVEVFQKLGVPKKDARTTADILIAADKRGIGSHGVARLGRYVKYLEDGLVDPKPQIKIVHETPVSATVDGGNGLGQVVGVWAMKKCIEKAKKSWMCFVAARRSNHYGIAGYYSMMALEEDLIGISLTNSAPLVVPTFGRDIVIGTNPIAVAVPTKNERPFVLDMATSTVPRGKLEVYNRLGKPLPLTWATDASGKPTSNSQEVLDNLLGRKGGGLLPLGGAEEETGGHKGFGLSALVDILSGVLSSGAYGPKIYPKKDGKPLPAGVCHLFGAMRIDAFVPLQEFKQNMDEFIRSLKNSNKAEGKNRIFIHGEKEYEKADGQEARVAISPKVADSLKEMGQKLGIPYTL